MIWQLDGIRPDIAEDAFVADSAQVIGNVRIGSEAGIWFGVVIRGDNELIDIGAGVNIQENSVLHTDEGYPMQIGANVTVGHKAMLHGCTIGEGALIGMGATVLNGAVIGKGALIGAGALITEGKVIPDGALVMGAPGKVVRELDEAGRQKLLDNAEHYRRNAARFRKGLAPA